MSQAQVEKFVAFVLLVQGVARGWVINHAVDGVLRFTCSFVHRDLQRMGRVLLLYNEAVARARGLGFSEGMWTIPMQHHGMARFARRWMQPYSTFFGETRGSRKPIVAGAA